MRISDWSSDVCSSDLGEQIAPDLQLRYLRNYIVESYLVAAKVAEKLRYLQPAQTILSWSIRILLVWLILVAATMALIPAKGPSLTVPVSAVENVLGTPASSPESPQAEAHDVTVGRTSMRERVGTNV